MYVFQAKNLRFPFKYSKNFHNEIARDLEKKYFRQVSAFADRPSVILFAEIMIFFPLR